MTQPSDATGSGVSATVVKPPAVAKPRLVDLIEGAKRQLGELIGYSVDSVSAAGKTDSGWRLVVTVIELNRIPAASDVLAEYEVNLDDAGNIGNYSRRRRFGRSQVGDEASE